MSVQVIWDGRIHSSESFIPSCGPEEAGLKRPRIVSAVNKALSEQVYAHAKAGSIPLALDGDHSLGIGAVSGVARAV